MRTRTPPIIAISAAAEKVHGEHAMRRVGVPDARRDPLKAEVHDSVAEALAADPTADQLHAAMIAKRG